MCVTRTFISAAHIVETEYSHPTTIVCLLLRALQKGVSGNSKQGCDAIIVSGGRVDGKGVDTFDSLVYYTATKEGAGSILTSARISMPIRVFQSSSESAGEYRAQHEGRGNRYRYDALYKVNKVRFAVDNHHGIAKTTDKYPPNIPPSVSGCLYEFLMFRVRKNVTSTCYNNLSPKEMLCVGFPVLVHKRMMKMMKMMDAPSSDRK